MVSLDVRGSRAGGGPEKSARKNRTNPDTTEIVQKRVNGQGRKKERYKEGMGNEDEVGALNKCSFGKGQPGVSASSHGRSETAESLCMEYRFIPIASTSLNLNGSPVVKRRNESVDSRNEKEKRKRKNTASQP